MAKNDKTILVTGANGQVGQELRRLSNDFSGFRFVFADIDELDITDKAAVSAFFSNTLIHYCINCAAFTAVDRAEELPEFARKINVTGVENLAVSCSDHGGRLIQLSTDYVYHNRQNTPFREEDPTNPQGVYARTKLAGDKAALEMGGMVIRSSWIYSSYGNNFVKTMLRLGRERTEIHVVFDQIGTPTYAHDLAHGIMTCITRLEDGTVGASQFNEIYHYSNEGVTSWYDFAVSIFEISGLAVKVLPIESVDYPTPASRPAFSVLNKKKIKSVFDLDIPHWRKSLKACLDLL